jgi:aspartyl protease family protein
MKRTQTCIFFFLIFILLLEIQAGCSGCSKSGLRAKAAKRKKDLIIRDNPYQIKSEDSGSQTGIEMENVNEAKYVWLEINGTSLRFLFRERANNIFISKSEFSVLFNEGLIQREDIIDIQNFEDRTGDIISGTGINLRTVKIGNVLLKNLVAVVIDSAQAPLLLGRSTLEMFGNIPVDNGNKAIE